MAPLSEGRGGGIVKHKLSVRDEPLELEDPACRDQLKKSVSRVRKRSKEGEIHVSGSSGQQERARVLKKRRSGKDG